MQLILRVTIGLFAGLLLGVVISASHSSWLARVPGLLGPVGTLFVNAIRLAVIPLVVSGLIVGAAGGESPREMGRLGRHALFLILVMLLVSALFGVAVALPLFSFVNIDKNVIAALGENALVPQASQISYPSVGQWFSDLVPANIFKAAADGALLPLIVASIAFGLALSRIEQQRRTAVVQFFQGIADAFLRLVGYVVKLAPVGVFALAVPLAARMGIAAVGALAWYIAVFATVCTAFTVLVLYPAPLLFGRISLWRFARAALPAQAVAFTSRSSLAALPAAYEAARVGLGLPQDIRNFFLPIAASIFRAGAPMAQVTGVLFLAKLYGIALHPVQLATVVLAVVATSLTAPGIPGGSIIVMAPVLSSAHLPVAGIGILLALDTIPDMFRTTANVTGWLSVAGILGRPAPPDNANPSHGSTHTGASSP